jgi:hypothetical protein
MRTVTFLSAAIVCGLFAVPAAAHRCSGRHHGDGCGDCNSGYAWRVGPQVQGDDQTSMSPAKLQAVAGKVAEIIYLPGVTADSGMVEARVFSGGKNTLVRLAPVGLLKQQQLVLREGDSVSLTGYMVNGMEGGILIATEVRWGERRVALRDARGRLIQ